MFLEIYIYTFTFHKYERQENMLWRPEIYRLLNDKI